MVGSFGNRHVGSLFRRSVPNPTTVIVVSLRGRLSRPDARFAAAGPAERSPLRRVGGQVDGRSAGRTPGCEFAAFPKSLYRQDLRRCPWTFGTRNAIVPKGRL